jgi:ketosteroid isomerase-like protein
MTMPESDRPQRARRSTRRGIVLGGGVLLAGVLMLAACGDDDDSGQSDPAAVLANYQDTRNAGDVDALMMLYADDAVVTDHPRDNDESATGVDEIRQLEAIVPTIQRAEDATEFINVQPSGNTVTFDMNFHMADGSCLGSSGHEVTVDDDKITHYDWGSVDEPCQ